MWVVVGLGNPGPEYAASRHNVGFRVVEAFRRRHRFPGYDRRRQFESSRGRFRGQPLVLVRPLTYMNLSGQALLALASDTDLTPGEVLVIVDDVHLPLGRLRLRRAGGDGGHKGLRSLIDALGSQDFPRLRVGVGGPEDTGDLVEYVLDEFDAAQAEEVERSIDNAVDAVEIFLGAGIDAAMNRFNAPPAGAGDDSPPPTGDA